MTPDEAPLFIDDRWTPASGLEFESKDPASAATLWTGKSATLSEVAAAIAAARKAFPEWCGRSVEERVQLIQAFSEVIESQKERFAEALSQEVGKPYWESLTEVGAMKGKIRFSIEAYEKRRSSEVADQMESPPPHASSLLVSVQYWGPSISQATCLMHILCLH